MFKELLSIFRGDNPLQEISHSFREMLRITEEMVLEASAVYWGKELSAEQRTALYKRDVDVNRLERSIRKKLVGHLSMSRPMDVPYCLLLMSLVKDVERLGDYAKNLAEVSEFANDPFPRDDATAELKEIRNTVETLAREALAVFTSSDLERALELISDGRSVSKRCDELLRKIAKADYSATVAVSMVLGTRFYKRLGAHILNVLSSVVMPLHKVDYYDEDFLKERATKGTR